MRNLDDYIQNPTHKLIAEAYRKAKTPEDKYAKTGLKPIEIDGTMAIEQATRIMICKKMFDGPIDPKNICPCENKERYFDKNNPKDFHTMYMGQVLKILEKKK